MCRYENSGRRSLVLVMFIGGVTFAEISALRFLNAQVKNLNIVFLRGEK